MELTGWTKNWRKKWENPSLRGRPNHLLVWDWVLSHAVWKDVPTRFAGELVVLKPGQVVCGSKQIAADTGVPESSVRRTLAELESERLLERRVSNAASLVSVTNWDRYQGDERQDERPVSGQRAASERPVSTKEEAKNVKNVQEVKKDAPRESVSDGPPIDPRERERRFKALLLQQQWCDEGYADKTWEQGIAMPDRAEFVRKVNLLLGWARIPSKVGKAKVLYHEIAGFVNDRGAMQQRLTPAEVAERRQFREEAGQELESA